MVDNDGNAILLDFGLSRFRFETTRQLTNIQVAGYIRFLAPELSSGEGNFRTTEKSDVYSLGMLIYQLLYDIAPFNDLPNDPAVMRAVMDGRTPGRPNLPDRRAKLISWREVEEKLWPLLQAAWMEQQKRTGLLPVHATV